MADEKENQHNTELKGNEDQPMMPVKKGDANPNGNQIDPEAGGQNPADSNAPWYTQIGLRMKNNPKTVGVIMGILIFVLVLCLAVGLGLRNSDEQGSTKPTTKGPTTPKITHTPTPGFVTIPPSRHVPRLEGSVTTDENYTKAMDDPTSTAFKTLASNFSSPMATLFEGSPYSASYNDTIVRSIHNENVATELIFEVLLNTFLEAEEDTELTFLDKELRTGSLGTIRIIDHSLKAVVS